MKDDTINWDKRDISGTVCGPNAYLAYLRRSKCSPYLVHTWPLFYYPRLHSGYCRDLKAKDKKYFVKDLNKNNGVKL